MPVWWRKNCTKTEGLENPSSSDISSMVLSVVWRSSLQSLSSIVVIQSETERPLIRRMASEKYFGVRCRRPA